MTKQFNPSRLKIARLRKRLTYKVFAEALDMSSKMVSLYEKDNDHIPPETTLHMISKVTGYPVDFFFGIDIEEVDPLTVSFRSLKSMTQAKENAAIAAGQIGFIVNDLFESEFNLPSSELPDMRGVEPSIAAEEIRGLWDLGDKGIKNLVHLFESKGIRVFSLAENTIDVDAFSFWKSDKPFIFLNTQKTGERSRFDAAHELGHLLLHRHATPVGENCEAEADKFAAAFLMPESSVLATAPSFITLSTIISLKKNWLVSVGALIVRLKNLNMLTEWQYRTLMIEMSQAGYRKNEPEGIERERSLVISKILSALKAEGIGIPQLAKRLNLPTEELSNLLFKPTIVSSNDSQHITQPPTNIERPGLTLVHNSNEAN